MNEKIKLEIKIDNSHPIELLDLARSFSSFADEYKNYIAETEDEVVADEFSKLYVKELRSGSIIAELGTYAPAIAGSGIVLAENANTIIEFTSYLKTAIQTLLQGDEGKPGLSKKSYENISNILAPVVKDSAAQYNLNTTINGNVIINVALNSNDATVVHKRAEHAIETLRKPVENIHKDVWLRWYQARNDAHSRAGDKAVIHRISRKRVKVVFANEETKAKILSQPDNLFSFEYKVDVTVEFVREKPASYKILKVHEKRALGENDAQEDVT